MYGEEVLIKKNGVDINALDVEEWRIAEVFIEKKLIKELGSSLVIARQLHGFSSHGIYAISGVVFFNVGLNSSCQTQGKPS